MIIKEFYMTRKDGVNLYRTYSDAGFQIIQIETGHMYEDAPYTYKESDQLIEPIEVME